MSELFIFTGVYSEIAFLSPDVCKPSNHFLPFFFFFCSPCRSSAGRYVSIRVLSEQKNGNLLIFFVNKMSSNMNVYSYFLQYQNVLRTINVYITS